MTELSITQENPTQLAVDAIVVGVYRRGNDPASALLLATGGDPVAAAVQAKHGAELLQTMQRLGASGRPDEVTMVPTFGALAAPIVAAVGLGDLPDAPAESGIPAETLRRAAGAAVRALAGSSRIVFALPVPDDAAVRAVCEGARLGGYQFNRYRTRRDPGARQPVGSVLVAVPDAPGAGGTTDAELTRLAEHSVITTEAVNRARDWVNTAPNDLRPPQFADEVAAAARDAGLQVDILDEQAMEREGFGGILAVGLGSAAAPRLVRLSYRPDGATTRIALVGKGVTFDSGGLSIKPAHNMWTMKTDMAGAAAVAAVMLAVARLRPGVAVTAYLPMAENMPSGSAYRPGDVVRMRNGKHVEILNTDAEGRLLLADAIAWACEDSPDVLIETSTLTGGQVTSLGLRVAGVMGTAATCERVRAAGERVGEPAWPMPLPDEIRTTMDSDIADLLQVSAGMERSGHMLQGGTFLSEFVPDGVPWAHIDIAGPSNHSGKPTGYWPTGATGVPVRTLIELIEDLDS